MDSGDKNLDIEAMKQYAKQYHLIMIASGEKDIITDGTAVYICENGDAKMAKITGSGCMSSVMLGALKKDMIHSFINSFDLKFRLVKER